MTSNFDFLTSDFPEIYESATRVENLALIDSRACCFYARYTLEQAVIWLYDNDPYLKVPYDNNLGALIHEQTFKDNLSPNLFPKIRIIQKMGNRAAHSNQKISQKDGLYITQELFHFLYWLCRYYSPNGKNLPQLQFIPPSSSNISPLQNEIREKQPSGKEAKANQTPSLPPSPKREIGGEVNILPKEPITPAQLQKLEQELSQAQEMATIAEKRQKQTEEEYNQLKAQITQLKQANNAVKDNHDYNEADTRKYLIDVLLKEMGWDITQPDFTEYEVTGMPVSVNPTGKGYIDYVLWDDNGLPLAVIEAKRTQKDAHLGKQQAKLYADCLENKFQQRPIIFYSNGYQTYLWDDHNYPPRPVEGFLKKDELQRMIYRRSHGKPLEIVLPNQEIAGRSYQIEAIKRVTEIFDQEKARKALLVMATGTGKTRTAIALIDVLTRANRIKRVLFLADRTSLLTQAKRAIQKHLPHASAVDLTKEKDVSGANIILSTYPTMMNRIDCMDAIDKPLPHHPYTSSDNHHPYTSSDNNGDSMPLMESNPEEKKSQSKQAPKPKNSQSKESPSENRLFGIGYFDLIIIDEAHRSIYKKYQALFTYFDALLIGLTATPRNEINRDTYRIFDLEAGNPTFAYELQDAINDGYLVPPTGIKVPFKFLRRGVKYAELNPEEKLEYEEKFYDQETGEIPDEINAAALNRWLFNEDTVDKALETLMDWGIKVHQGDRLGKTIIFARNHQHALFIEERFNHNYPHFKGSFARIIDSHDNYAQSILDDFCDSERQPIIAISVDMLDTGVDVPEVVNLVFFKPVYSEVKFNQMIGRGTRLCPNLFGIDRDKKEFLVFDLCDNFAYFSQEITENNPPPTIGLNSRLLKAKLELQEYLLTIENINPNQDSNGDNSLINQVSNPSNLQRETNSQGGYSLKEAQTNPYSLAQTESQELSQKDRGKTAPAKSLRDKLLDELHNHVSAMEENNFLVRRHLQKVETFKQRDKWDNLTPSDKEIILNTLIHLPSSIPPESPRIKNFDLLCLKVQLAILTHSNNFETLRDKIRDLLVRLQEKQTIPSVKAKLELIEEVQSESWWQDIGVEEVEKMRLHLRDLVTFIDKQDEGIIYTDFADELGEIEEVNIPQRQTGFSPYQYKKKVEAYIRANQDHIVIAKLRKNLPLTEGDLKELERMLFTSEEIDSRDKFELVYGQKNLKSFIRKLVGLDRNTAKQAFSKYLESNNLTANQIRFIDQIINWLTKYGVMNPSLLYGAPFTDIHTEGLDGVFNDEDADNIIDIVSSFNEVVEEKFNSA
ncbi:DEAD/DEAH box helicase family protein (plasmid) [Cyanobacterium sp. IPPAS B-1200]|uniref:DEAD/DEAH box helicase family protein n=1 Tax=Cyanobacterium sp. IPPAS B-1200 TaxID=1562720 RepID=UPI0008687A84|nr:DEAD/DEAH box helicase family protein [Cyanobacterium sp. IPPAS B-1200]OEJ78372.1 heavy metal transporter [Cyanobacterium sp. IPPAS B-1200]